MNPWIPSNVSDDISATILRTRWGLPKGKGSPMEHRRPGGLPRLGWITAARHCSPAPDSQRRRRSGRSWRKFHCVLKSGPERR